MRFVITAREEFSSLRLGLEVAAALLRLFPGKIALDANLPLIGNEEVIKALASGADPRQIEQRCLDNLADFLKLREKYLLYR